MITRNDILNKALHECLVEMYKWSQPSIDLDELIKNGFKDDRNSPLYEKHYLSQNNFIKIRDTYAHAYGIDDDWNDTFELLINQLREGGMEDDYKPGTEERPGYRDYKKVKPLSEVISNPDDVDTVIEYIKKCQNFYKGHSRDTDRFNISVSLGASPTSNAKTVKEYWRNNGRPDFEIKNFDIDDVIYGSEEYEDISDEEFINSLK